MRRAPAVYSTSRVTRSRLMKQLNPNDKPDIERVKDVPGGSPDKWRSGRS